MTLLSLSIYVVFVDPHQGNSVLCLSLPTTKAYVELIGVKKAQKSILAIYIVKSNLGSKES